MMMVGPDLSPFPFLPFHCVSQSNSAQMQCLPPLSVRTFFVLFLQYQISSLFLPKFHSVFFNRLSNRQIIHWPTESLPQMASYPAEELMKVPMWAWWTFALSLALVIIFLLLDWLLIRRNALSSPMCFSFRRHPSGKYGYASASHCSGGMGMGGQDYYGAGGMGGGGTGGGGGALGHQGSGGGGQFGHHKRSTNLILSV